MGEPSWSLHLLSEILSAFNLEDPDALRNVIHRVGEAVDAEVVALLAPGRLIDGIGLVEKDLALLMAASDQRPQQLQVASGLLHCQWGHRWRDPNSWWWGGWPSPLTWRSAPCCGPWPAASP